MGSTQITSNSGWRSPVPLLLVGLLSALTGAVLGAILSGHRQGTDDGLIEAWVWTAVGTLAGSVGASLQWHPRRRLGMVPFGATGLLFGLILVATGSLPGPFGAAVAGTLCGLVIVPLASAGNCNLHFAIGSFLVCAILSSFLVTTEHYWPIVAVAAAGTVLSWWFLWRPFAEQIAEFILAPFYQIRAHGPGRVSFPMRGPLLVVANHSAWVDPFLIGKVVPRRIIPMMTSLFYDVPIVHWLVRHIVQAIRVQAVYYRREAPELAEAIAAMDRGLCVVMFPEGAMRRREKQGLRQFAQGVWHILKERPQTPVVVCWIEGGWGSFFSYFNGPPAKNKRVDFRRSIDIAVTPAQILDADTLVDHRTTRLYLMRECVQARSILGLEPMALPDIIEDPDQAETVPIAS